MYNYQTMPLGWKNLFLSLAIVFMLLAPVVSFANVTTCPAGKICNPITQNSLNDFVKAILEGVIKIGIPIIALAFIYSGFLFVKAQGNSEDLTKAKNALLFSVVGAALVLGAWALAQLISETVLSL